MQFSDVKQVKQVAGAGNANTMLNEGWVLLAVVPATLNSPSGSSPSVMYVLGKPAEPEKGSYKDGEFVAETHVSDYDPFAQKA